MSGPPPALAFEDVGVRLGESEVLRGVSLAVEPGEIVALVGPNGAGKTTLFRVASRVLAPQRGVVRLGGREIDAYGRRALAARIAVVPQEVNVPFPFSVGEVVLMGRFPHLGALGFESPRDVELARAAMTRVGIAELADRSVLELSGGERQLALVARALVQDPTVLLLDEPTAHLDLRHRMSVLEVVRELADAGRAALVVSHDLTLAARSCDRIALLSGGALLEVGPPDQVLTPDNLRRGFGIEAEVLHAADGTPLVLPC